MQNQLTLPFRTSADFSNALKEQIFTIESNNFCAPDVHHISSHSNPQGAWALFYKYKKPNRRAPQLLQSPAVSSRNRILNAALHSSAFCHTLEVPRHSAPGSWVSWTLSPGKRKTLSQQRLSDLSHATPCPHRGQAGLHSRGRPAGWAAEPSPTHSAKTGRRPQY